MITGEQIKAARALLGITAAQLAKGCGVSEPTIQRMETTRGTSRALAGTLYRVQSCLEAQGITFFETWIGNRRRIGVYREVTPDIDPTNGND